MDIDSLSRVALRSPDDLSSDRVSSTARLLREERQNWKESRTTSVQKLKVHQTDRAEKKDESR